MIREISHVPDWVAAVTSFPYLRFKPQFFPDAIREAVLNELHYAFQSKTLPGSQKHMKVIGHQNEGVERIFSAVLIVSDRVQEQPCHRLDLKERTMSPRACGHKVRGRSGSEGLAVLVWFGHISNLSG